MNYVFFASKFITLQIYRTLYQRYLKNVSKSRLFGIMHVSVLCRITNMSVINRGRVICFTKCSKTDRYLFSVVTWKFFANIRLHINTLKIVKKKPFVSRSFARQTVVQPHLRTAGNCIYEYT